MRFKHLFAAFLLPLVLTSVAISQSNPGLKTGQVPTATDWNSYFSAKEDVIGYPPVNLNGDTMGGELQTIASSSLSAGFRIIPGTAPSSPHNGDLWMTGTAMFGRINGLTVQFGTSVTLANIAYSGSASDLNGGTVPYSVMPFPGVSSGEPGGVIQKTCSSHQFGRSVNALGVLGCAQPASTDVSGINPGTIGKIQVSDGSGGIAAITTGPLCSNQFLIAIDTVMHGTCASVDLAATVTGLLGDSHISSAAAWNAKFGSSSLGNGVIMNGSVFDTTMGIAKRLAASATQSPTPNDCSSVVPGSALSLTLFTMPNPAPAGCEFYAVNGLQGMNIDFNGYVTRMPCFGGHDVSILHVPFVIENSYLDENFDGTQFNLGSASRLQYEGICAEDDQQLINGQVQVTHNSGSSRFEIAPFYGPGGVTVHGQMHNTPDVLYVLDSSTISNAVNYLYIPECGAAAVSGTSNQSGTIRLTLDCVGGNTGERIEALCHSIHGTVAANGFNPGVIVDSTHVDLVGPTFDSSFVNTGSPKCRITYGAMSTSPPTRVGGIEVNSADHTQTLAAKIVVGSSHSITSYQSTYNGIALITGAVAGDGTGYYTQASFSDVLGLVSPSQLPNPTASTLGGIESLVAVSHKWINTISTSGVPSATQPDFSDLSGSLSGSQFGPLTGDVTTSGYAATISAIQGTTVGGTTGSGNVVLSASPTLSGTVNGGNVVLTGSLKSTSALGGNNLAIDTAAGHTRLIGLLTSNSARWQFGANASAESGSNAGSDFIVTRFSDAGSSIDNPILVTRSTGVVTFVDGVDVTGAGGSCTNQFVRSISTTLIATCAAVSLGADVSGQLPLANGGCNGTSAPTCLSNIGGAPLASPTFTGTVTQPDGSTCTSSGCTFALIANFTAALSSNADFYWTSDITPTNLSGSVNDYAPTGFATATVIRQSASAGPFSITGLAGGADGRMVIIENTGVNSFILVNASASSSAANRFLFGDGDLTLTSSNTVVLTYDATTQRWRRTGGSQPPTISLTAGVSGLLPIANGGTNASSAATALSNLGGAPLASPTFTGTVTMPDGSTITSSAWSIATTVGMTNHAITALANLTSNNSSGYLALAGATSSTVPVLIPNRSSTTTGIGAQASGNMSLIGAGTEMMRITSTLITLPTIGSDATHTDSTVCQDTTSHALYSGSGTLGVCLGTSSKRFKHGIVDMSVGLDAILSLRPRNFYFNTGYGDPKKLQYGFIAEEAEEVLPKLVGYDTKKRPNSFDYIGLIPILVKGEQELAARVKTLEDRIAKEDAAIASLTKQLSALSVTRRRSHAH